MDFQEIIKTYSAREDLHPYSQNALMLWALQIRFQIEDIEEFASSCLTDNGDDKKCDLIWVNRDEGFAIIAQDYFSLKAKKEAPANKASDLNTTVAWVLGTEDLHAIPETIRYGVKEVREAIEKKEINQIYIFYIHNLPESINVEHELRQVKTTADKYLAGRDINVFVKEVGQSTLIEWYENLQNPILVTDEFELPYEQGILVEGDKWKSILTNVSGITLKEWFTNYGDKLFSANHRDYLGSRNSDKNINNGIKNTAKDKPENFWVYNNGISIITNNVTPDKENKKIKVSGISIINGAQTTGSIGSVEEVIQPSLQVSCRFIECKDQEIIKEIVRFNNLQNKLISSDFRSNDRIQKRIADEFSNFSGERLVYAGGRRGGASDAIQRRPNLISSDTVAQTLTAFHGRPDIGYKFKSQIWEENDDYKRIFNDKTSAQHILFVYSLFKEIINTRMLIKQKFKNGVGLTDLERSQMDFFNARGSVFVLIYAISNTLEIFLNKKIDDKFDLYFKEPNTIEEYQSYWKPIVSIALSFSKQLLTGLQNYSLTMESISNAMSDFTGLVQAVAEPNSERMKIFAEKVS